MAVHCIISFGSNLGHREELISSAARIIADSSLVTADFQTSRLFETPPIGGPGGQEPFFNAIAVFETSGSARQVLDLLQSTERDLGRQRRQRWDARSIDLDVVLHGELMGGGSGLIVPHPRYTARQFVLQPAGDVAAHLRDPRFGWTLGRLTEHVSLGLPSMALVGGELQIRQEICRRLNSEHGIKTFAAYPASQSIPVVANAPLACRPKGRPNEADDAERASGKEASESGQPIEVTDQQAWVAAYLPELPDLDGDQTNLGRVPRLVARLQRTTDQARWPAPHQIWPAGWRWPEYRLEIDDLDWAVSEVAAALDSMRCPVWPITADGNWWR